VAGDENQVILTFCVLLLTVGVLTILFTEFENRREAGSIAKTSEMMAELDSGLELGDDMIWRPVTLAQKRGIPPLSDSSLRVAGVRVQVEMPQIRPKTIEAPLRWELNLGSTGSYLTD